MTDVSLDQLLKSLIQHVSEMRGEVKTLEGAVKQIPHETPPDLRPDLKKLYELCLELSKADAFKEAIAEEAREALTPLKANLMRAQNDLTHSLHRQLDSLSQGLGRLAFAFNKRSAAIGALLTAGVLVLFLSAGYGLRYYQGKTLVDQAQADSRFSTLKFDAAKSIEARGLEMVNGDKTLKEFVKNGNNPAWLKGKGQGSIRRDEDGRRICAIEIWLDPPKK